MATLSDMRDEVRRRIGSPDTTEVPNSDIEAVIQIEALDWLNRRLPGRKISSFTTVKDQQDYDEKPANAYLVTAVWWMESDFQFFSPSMKYVAQDQDINEKLAGFDIYKDTALVEAFYKQLETYKHNFKGEGFETDEGKIRLEPVPSSGGDTVYFEYSYPRWSDPTGVPDRLVPGLKKKAAAIILDYLAVRRGRVRGGRNFTGGGGEREANLAGRFHAEADGEVPALTVAIGRG